MRLAPRAWVLIGATGLLVALSGLGACWVSLDGLAGNGDASTPDVRLDQGVDAAPKDALQLDAPHGDAAADAPSRDANPCADVDLASDPNNCGACGHGCLDAACADAACQPIILSTGDNYPNGIAVDSTQVYWVDEGSNATDSTNGQLRSCAIGGCKGSPTILAANQDLAWDVAVSSGVVYWSANSGGPAVLACPISGCGDAGARTITTYPSGAAGLAVDTSNVYFTCNTSDLATSFVLSCALTGCGSTPTVIASEQILPFTIAIDDTNVYWLEEGTGTEGQLQSCPKGGSCTTPTLIATGLSYPSGLTVQGTNVYFSSGPSVQSCPVTGCGGSPTTLATDLTAPYGVAVDDTYIYFTNYTSAGTVQRCPLTGCSGPPETLLSNLSSPGAIAVDARAVYVANYGAVDGSGSVMEVAK
jgi:hypothetical protein